jgi:hypothetical protein
MASISTVPFTDKRTQSAMRGANPENFDGAFFSGHAMREPRRFIYIHTVARRTLPPIKRKLFPGIVLRACENGERTVMCTPIPDPVPEMIMDEMNGGRQFKEHPGWRAAIDLLNPKNYSDDPFLGSNNPDFFANRNGSNLIAEGYWPSLNEVPTEEEIKRAEKHRDAHYRWLTREATRLAARSKKDLDEFLQNYPDTYNAMDALGIKSDWHTPSFVTSSCPNCGDAIRQGLAFHKSSVTDRLCVIDAEKAYRARAITKEEYEELVTVPDDPGPEQKQRQSRMKPIV